MPGPPAVLWGGDAELLNQPRTEGGFDWSKQCVGGSTWNLPSRVCSSPRRVDSHTSGCQVKSRCVCGLDGCGILTAAVPALRLLQPLRIRLGILPI